MATLPGDRLAQAHRRAQVRNALELAVRVRGQFVGLDPSNAAAGRNFLDAATELTLQYNRRAALQSQAFLRALQPLEASGPSRVVDLADPPPVAAVRRSLAITGPVTLRQRLDALRENLDQSGRPTVGTQRSLAAARQSATAAVVGSAIRHAQNGARDTVIEFTKGDRRARGYVRVTSGDERVCYFCAMLGGRVGYSRDSFEFSDSEFEGPGTAKVHDSCRCHLRPVYGKELPDEVLAYQQHWRDLSGAAIDGKDRGAAKNFRSQWEARLRTGVAALAVAS